MSYTNWSMQALYVNDLMIFIILYELFICMHNANAHCTKHWNATWNDFITFLFMGKILMCTVVDVVIGWMHFKWNEIKRWKWMLQNMIENGIWFGYFSIDKCLVNHDIVQYVAAMRLTFGSLSRIYHANVEWLWSLVITVFLRSRQTNNIKTQCEIDLVRH